MRTQTSLRFIQDLHHRVPGAEKENSMANRLVDIADRDFPCQNCLWNDTFDVLSRDLVSPVALLPRKQRWRRQEHQAWWNWWPLESFLVLRFCDSLKLLPTFWKKFSIKSLSPATVVKMGHGRENWIPPKTGQGLSWEQSSPYRLITSRKVPHPSPEQPGLTSMLPGTGVQPKQTQGLKIWKTAFLLLTTTQMAAVPLQVPNTETVYLKSHEICLDITLYSEMCC